MESAPTGGIVHLTILGVRISPPSQGGVASPAGEDGVVTTEGTSSPQHNADSTETDEIAPQNMTEDENHIKSTNKPSAHSSSPYAIYNIGNSNPVQLMEYINAIEVTLGKTAQKEFLPGMIYLTGLPMQPGDVPKTEADVSDLVKELGYKPDTPVQKGIEKFIEWYNSYFQTTE